MSEEKTPAVQQPIQPPATVAAPREGFEGDVDPADLVIPRAKLLQALSPEVSDPNLTVRAGQIINNLTKEVLPSEFCVIKKDKFWVRFNPRNESDPNFSKDAKPGAMMWLSRDPNDPRVKEQSGWGEDGSKPVAASMLNFLCMFKGVDMPVMLTFANTSYKAGKELLSLLQFGSGSIYSTIFRVESISKENEKGKFFVLKVVPAGKCEGEQYAKASAMFKSFTKVDLSAHVENPEGGTKTDAAPADRPY